MPIKCWGNNFLILSHRNKQSYVENVESVEGICVIFWDNMMQANAEDICVKCRMVQQCHKDICVMFGGHEDL